MPEVETGRQNRPQPYAYQPTGDLVFPGIGGVGEQDAEEFADDHVLSPPVEAYQTAGGLLCQFAGKLNGIRTIDRGSGRQTHPFFDTAGPVPEAWHDNGPRAGMQGERGLPGYLYGILAIETELYFDGVIVLVVGVVLTRWVAHAVDIITGEKYLIEGQGQDVRGGQQDLLVKLDQGGIEEGRVSQLRCQFFVDIRHDDSSIQIADVHIAYDVYILTLFGN